MSQDPDLRQHGIPEFSPSLDHWRLYVGCTVEALVEFGAGYQWNEGRIEEVNNVLLDGGVEKQGVFFQIRYCLTCRPEAEPAKGHVSVQE